MRRSAKFSIGKAALAKLAGLCVLSLSPAALSQDAQPAPPAAPTKAAPANPSWMVNCTSIAGGFDCRASQTLISQNTRQRILTLVVRTTPQSKKPVMMIQAPLGIYLPAGITLQVGKDAAKRLAVQSCDQGGCLAEYALTDAEIAALRGGADITLTVQDTSKKPAALTVPGIGFDAAFAKLQ